MSLRDQILKVQDHTSTKLEIPEWKVTIEVRSMPASARLSMIDEGYDQDSGKVNITRLTVTCLLNCVFDPQTGERVFTEDDVPALLEKSADVIDRIVRVANEQSALHEKALTDSGKALLEKTSDDSSMN